MISPLLDIPLLVLVTNRNVVADKNELIARIDVAAQHGVNIVQIRENDLPPEELYELCREVKTVVDGRALVMINDKVDIGASAELDGAHLTEHSMSLENAREIMGAGAVFSSSSHDVERAVQLCSAGIDFIIAGTMFETETHPGKIPEGLKLLEDIKDKIDCPIVGIGGITLNNLDDVINSGAIGVAVIREILTAKETDSVTKDLRSKLDEVLNSIND